MMRIAVMGAKGQVATALVQQAGPEFQILTLSRPAFSLENRDSVLAGVRAARPDVVINAAAYTAVDRAESEQDLAMQVNGEGAGYVAEAAAAMNAPLLHLSTDYVFDGSLHRPYREDDPTGPTGAYGRSKLAGEERVAKIWPNSGILRTAWVYSPFGANFVRTMLQLNETRDEVGVVADQQGNPTSALDIADALLVIARRIRDDSSSDTTRPLPYDRLWRSDLGRLRRGPRPRPTSDPGQTHHDCRLSHARETSGQLAPRQRKAAARLRCRAASLAGVARSLLRAAHSITQETR